jgi:hypothetical protein
MLLLSYTLIIRCYVIVHLHDNPLVQALSSLTLLQNPPSSAELALAQGLPSGLKKSQVVPVGEFLTPDVC